MFDITDTKLITLKWWAVILNTPILTASDIANASANRFGNFMLTKQSEINGANVIIANTQAKLNWKPTVNNEKGLKIKIII